MKIATEKNSKILILIGIGLLIFGLFFFLYTSNLNVKDEIDTSKFSEFGDYFGGVIGAIWSLAGVILLYVALEEQRKDIKINQNALIKQIEEFELQRVELSETRKVFKEQSVTLKIQRFENTFFQLINLYNEIISNLQLTYQNKSYEKRDIFAFSLNHLSDVFYSYLKNHEQNEIGEWKPVSEIQLKEFSEVEPHINSAYINFYYDTTNQKFSNYFRTVYHIFKFIHKSDLLDENNKQFYASIFRAQLSSDELFLIYYNSIHKNLGFPNMLFLITRFDILQNFDLDLVTRFKFHHELFNFKKIEIENFEL